MGPNTHPSSCANQPVFEFTNPSKTCNQFRSDARTQALASRVIQVPAKLLRMLEPCHANQLGASWSSGAPARPGKVQTFGAAVIRCTEFGCMGGISGILGYGTAVHSLWETPPSPFFSLPREDQQQMEPTSIRRAAPANSGAIISRLAHALSSDCTKMRATNGAWRVRRIRHERLRSSKSDLIEPG